MLWIPLLKNASFIANLPQCIASKMNGSNLLLGTCNHKKKFAGWMTAVPRDALGHSQHTGSLIYIQTIQIDLVDLMIRRLVIHDSRMISKAC